MKRKSLEIPDSVRAKRSSAAAIGSSPHPRSPRAPHFIVGVGASAGGLEALGKLFANMPTDSGLSFVVVQHLSPDYKSFMVELLSKRTTIPVLRAEDGLEVKPNCIYLIPPKKNLKIFQGRLQLVDPDMSRGFNLPIDVFFRSLAEEKQHQAIGIVLSGTGSDGTMGIRAIKDLGGMVMVQSEATAQFDGMPRSAIGTGLADSILPPDEMPKQLVTYLQHPFVAKQKTLVRSQSSTDSLMHKLFALLREQCGVDFSFYKPSTIDRRIERRITINQLTSLEEYYLYLQSSPRECSLLFHELLICVTRFFRDRESFDFLEKSVIPEIYNCCPPGDQIRIWVPSCSTGEEAYSLAMLFADEMRRQEKRWPVKIFATDISKRSIDIASLGIYSESEVADVPADKLRRYFERTPEGWRVTPQLRTMVVFAKHDLLKDPPFTKLDFVSCRNVLIYFQPELQLRVINLFHFALKPEGTLFLGSSETVGDQTDKFHTVSTRHKVYRTRPGVHATVVESLPPGPEHAHRLELPRQVRNLPAPETRAMESVYQQIVAEYCPACIVVDENNEVTHVLGKAGDFLRTPAGAFTQNILKLTSHNLSLTLATMLHRVARDGRPYSIDNVRFRQDRKMHTVSIRVTLLRPKQQHGPKFRLIFIKPKTSAQISKAAFEEFKADHTTKQRIADLEQELVYGKETLQATIEELETANEELQAANEELLASNEELQSTNEELQSLNEELHTVNIENQNRIEELTALGNDINNLLASARVGTMLVDKGLRIRRMSAAVHTLTGLSPTDTGVPLEVLSRDLKSPELIELAQRVMREEQPLEHLAAAISGRSVLVRIAPYKTETNATDGVVVTLIDMTEPQRRAGVVQSVIDALPANIAVVDETGEILFANEAWTSFGRVNGAGIGCGAVGDNYFEVCRRSTPTCPEAGRCLEGFLAVLRGDLPHFEMEYPCHSEREKRWFLVGASPLAGGGSGLVISHLNITHRKEEEMRGRALDTMPQSAKHAVVGFDLEGKITSWNAGAEQLFGCSAAEAVGKEMSDFTPPSDLEAQSEQHERIRRGEPLACQFGLRLTQGAEVIGVGILFSPMLDAGGALVGIYESLCKRSTEALPDHHPSEVRGFQSGARLAPRRGIGKLDANKISSQTKR